MGFRQTWLGRWLGGWLGLDDHSFRGRLISAAARVGVTISWGSALINLVLGSPIWGVVLNMVAGFAVIGLMWLARRTGRYSLVYLIAVVTLFLIVFPVLFFTGGGYHSGMPVFFMFAIAFSAIILEGRALWVLVPLEAVVFTACLLIAYLEPRTITPLASELAVLADIAYAVTGAGLALVVALRLLIGIYQRNQRKLTEQNEALARVDRARAEFLALVAHELNTPLTVIKAHAEEAGRELTHNPGQAGVDVEVIETEVDRLGRLVNQLLDLSRINEGRFVLELATHDLDAIVQQTLQAYRPLWTQRGNTLSVIGAHHAPTVMVDRERVIQVLVNLISNASRHTDHGSITIQVELTDDQALVTVADTGSGIPAELLGKLGDAPLRERPEGLRSARDAGLGVGLMISKHIVTAHGGRFSLASVVGEGTTASFTLPLAAEAPV
jgi:Signal transduction histidine kinase